MCRLARFGVRLPVVGSGFRCLLRIHYSTATAAAATLSPSQLIVHYLINSLGFSKEAAISASTKVRRLKSAGNPDLVIHLFKQSGFHNTHIRKIISSEPVLLLSKVDATLKPKIRVLQDLGLFGPDLGEVISGHPSFLRKGLDTCIIPSINYLKNVLGSDENVVKAIKRTYLLLSCNAAKRMAPNVLLLQNYGFSDDQIKKYIFGRPRHLLQNPEWLADILHRVDGELGIPRGSRMFCYGAQVLASLRKSTIEMKFGIFRSFGWSNEDIITMARNLPFCLGLSEAKIRIGLSFFNEELGYTPGYLACHPNLLMLSLENRVVPRNEILKTLKEKKLVKCSLSLYSVVCLSDLKFVEKFVLPYKDDIPELHEAYVKNMALQWNIHNMGLQRKIKSLVLSREH